MEEHLTSHTCKSCGHVFNGNYCNICGEKVLRKSDRSFKRFLNTVFKALTFADSTFVISLWLVLKKPGFISKEFVEGRRVKYLKPVAVFFVLNLAYFFFPVIQLFNASLRTQLLTPPGRFYTEIIARKVTRMGIDFNGFKFIYDLKTVGLAKLMVMVFVIIASLPLNLLYRKKNRLFTDHIDYMTELACFNLFINAILLTIIASLGVGRYLDELVLTIIFISTNFYFILRSSAEFYNEKSWKLVLKSIVVLLFLKVALEIFRTILFFVTIWSI